MSSGMIVLVIFGATMHTKDETAQILSDTHFGLDEGIERIYRVVEEDESNPKKPVKLLEINPLTLEARYYADWNACRSSPNDRPSGRHH
jgi:hypothetical protein